MLQSGLSPFSITNSKPSTSARTAIHSETFPASAAITIASFKTTDKAIFSATTRRQKRPSSISSGILAKLLVISATSAASTAKAVPPAPIAIPTFAAASAGPSLIPSPTMPTIQFLVLSQEQQQDAKHRSLYNISPSPTSMAACLSFTHDSLFCGFILAMHSSSPSLFFTAMAVCELSPVIIADWTRSFRSHSIVSRLCCLIVSASASIIARLPSKHTNITVLLSSHQVLYLSFMYLLGFIPAISLRNS